MGSSHRVNVPLPPPGLNTSRQVETAGSGGGRGSRDAGWGVAPRLREDRPPEDHREGRQDPEETPRRGQWRQQTCVTTPKTSRPRKPAVPKRVYLGR